MEQRKQKPEWKVIKDFVNEEAGIVVRVSATDAYRPRYSYEVGRKLPNSDDNRIARHFGVFVEGQGKVNLRASLAEKTMRLVFDAEMWILNKCQEREDEIVEEKCAREQRDMDREKPKQRPGLKSLPPMNKRRDDDEDQAEA